MKYFTFLIAILIVLSSCDTPFTDEINSKRVNDDMGAIQKLPKTRTLGIVWEKYPFNNSPPLPIFPTLGSDPNSDPGIKDPWVIKVSDDDYRMWYTIIKDNSTDPSSSNKIYRIGHSTSPDGITWTDHQEIDTLVPKPSNNYDTPILGGVRVCGVIRTPYYGSGYIYKMWYLGKPDPNSSKDWKLYYAWSYDGLYWKKKFHDAILQVLGKKGSDLGEFHSSEIAEAAVLKDGTDYLMWLAGYDKDEAGSIGVFQSNLGTQEAWKYSNMAIKKNFAATFDIYSVGSPSVIKDEGVYKMWYTGRFHTNNLGLAYSLDGKKFYYYSQTVGDPNNREVLEPYAGGVRWERHGYQKVCVIRDDDKSSNPPLIRYKMWYAAEDNLGKFRIGYAQSYKRD